MARAMRTIKLTGGESLVAFHLVNKIGCLPGLGG